MNIKKIKILLVAFLLTFIVSFLWIYFYKSLRIDTNVTINSDIAYSSWNILYTWEYKTYYQDKFRSIKETWYFDKWQKSWEFVLYFPNKKINSKTKYKDWLKTWEFALYNNSWSIIEKSNYLSGKLNWELNSFEKWVLSKKEFYKNWVIDWVSQEFFANSKLKRELIYKNWVKNWKEVVYNESWDIIWEYLYKNNIMLSWSTFDEKTLALIFKMEYDAKRKVLRIIQYDKDWKIISITPKDDILSIESTSEPTASSWELLSTWETLNNTWIINQ